MLILLSIGAIILLCTEFGQRLLKRTIEGNISSGRFVLYEKMWEAFLSNPIIGKGFCSLKYLGTAQNGHNIYLQILGENGIIGISLMLIFFYGHFKKNVKKISGNKYDKEYVIVIIFGIIVQIIFLGWGITGNPLYDIYPFILYIVMISSLNSVYYIERKIVVK